ncbi:hypothetical protein [Candidatus Uabimicrobium amorphum]|uniref:DUF3592 domain-containing protein n=1 Tax=Uabimicrobium amorphum TaxID=2596890 RepID=A0A5S9IRD3_UABAM|nr:hypothetical protein [Candidatus Uabimicrobium amorphum]BBM86504.1 hypothetical protein UABAM_04890 [Candidatus Uabimicrobium amorphum]
MNKKLKKSPRDVSRGLRLNLLFGGFYNQFGWFFFGFGMIHVWVFGINADYLEYHKFFEQPIESEGSVTAVVAEDDSFRCNYEMNIDGTVHRGSALSNKKYDVGETVMIHHFSENPQWSQIHDLGDNGGIPFFIAWAASIFPLIGLTFVFFGIRRGKKSIFLITDGNETTGKLTNKEATNVRVNNQRVYKYTFEFKDDLGNTQQAIAKTHLQHILQNDEEVILYHPLRPSESILIDNLPGNPRVNEKGEFEAHIAKTILYSIIPGLAIFGHGTVLFYVLFA